MIGLRQHIGSIEAILAGDRKATGAWPEARFPVRMVAKAKSSWTAFVLVGEMALLRGKGREETRVRALIVIRIIMFKYFR
jgi:hypothetical protein